MKSTKIVNSIIAIAIAGVMAAGVCCLGFASRNKDGKWFGDFKNISGWHWTDKAVGDISGEDKDPDKDPDNGDKPAKGDGGAVVGGIENHGIQLLSAEIPREAYAANGISARAETAYALTASISPSEATNINVDWTVSWKNSSSAWASGKNASDYVSVVPTSDGALTANVSCLSAFGEQIAVTCTSRDNSEAKATCYFDYVKRVISAEVTLTGAGATAASGYTLLNCKSTVTVGYSVNYSAGTLTGTFKGGAITSELNYGLFSAAKSAVSNSSTTVFSQTSNVFILADLSNKTSVASEVKDPFAFISINGNPYNTRSEWSVAFRNYVSNNPNSEHLVLKMPYTYTYSGYSNANSTGTAKCIVRFNLSSVTVGVYSLGLDKTSGVF